MGKNIVYLLLGSNEGNRLHWLQECVALLEKDCGNILKKSAIYQTAAWGLEEQPDFLNMAVCVETLQSPLEALQAIQAIEQQLGRQRMVKWGQRTLDIDILLYNDAVITLPQLDVPHPHLPARRFALVPLCDIAGNVPHPVLKQTIAQLLHTCPDPLEVQKVAD